MSATSKRINVLVYAGSGATVESVRHATWSFRRLLGPHYAVLTVTSDQILKEPWAASCALLVFPGGADLGYCRTLDGAGNRRIRQYVQMGGAYLGLCAGGYYGSARCEWEVGHKGMEVLGERELAFFPGVARGCAFKGFVYHSEAGTRAVRVDVAQENLTSTPVKEVPTHFRTYYNGGGVFVDADKFKDRGVEVLARYNDAVDVTAGESGKTGAAAVVLCKVGEGAALLTGPHPEFSGCNLNHAEPSGHASYGEVVKALIEDDQQRQSFMKACLTRLGLQVSLDSQATPSLSVLHLSSSRPHGISELLQTWHEAGIITSRGKDSEDCIMGENDTFILQSTGAFGMNDLDDAISAPAAAEVGLVDYNAMPKRLQPHEDTAPDTKAAPYFNHLAYFAFLQQYQQNLKRNTTDLIDNVFGQTLLYGEVVTSTSTLLEKNPTLLSHLPNGFTATATTQVAGRGRGTNVWVSPPGSLLFSTVMRHSLALSSTAPVVFIQYLAAMAVVSAVHTYDPSTKTRSNHSYDAIPIRLKWPNDIHALDPTAPANELDKKYVKIGGILVNSSYSGGDYTLVCGIGLNVANTATPTTSLSALAQKYDLPPFKLEQLLASILTQFEVLYTRFCRTGFDAVLEKRYYDAWLHREQIVTLEMEGGARARILGITKDWGLLVAEELGWEDRPTGKRFALQSDSNSFDFFKGLLKRKV